MSSLYALRGDVEIDVVRNGKVVDNRRVHNRIVDSGCALIASLLDGGRSGQPAIPTVTHCAIGSDDTIVRASNTKLGAKLWINEITEFELNGPTIEFTTRFEPKQPDFGRVRVCEVGLFNGDGDDAVMLNRAIFAPINKMKDDVIVIRWAITIVSIQSEYDQIPPDETPGLINSGQGGSGDMLNGKMSWDNIIDKPDLSGYALEKDILATIRAVVKQEVQHATAEEVENELLGKNKKKNEDQAGSGEHVDVQHIPGNSENEHKDEEKPFKPSKEIDSPYIN